VILNEIEARIKLKIESIGIPLKKWDIQINYGIKTGFNEAFIVDQAKRDELLKNCPEADEIIRPILRGRDIKKYNAKFANQWIINSHNGIKEREIAPINVQDDFPIIYKHLENFKNELVKRLDQGKHWSNLRNCAYIDDLDKEKLIWIELTDHPNFALDTNGYYLNNTIFS
jgi:adenine-specific DNA-methyltransferase